MGIIKHPYITFSFYHKLDSGCGISLANLLGFYIACPTDDLHPLLTEISLFETNNFMNRCAHEITNLV